MHSGKYEVIEDIPVPEEFVELIKCSGEDIWSDDDEFFDKYDPLKTNNLRYFFKHYKSLPKRPSTYLTRAIQETEPSVSESEGNTKCKKIKKHCRSEEFSPSGTSEWCSNIVSIKKEDESEKVDITFSNEAAEVNDKEYGDLSISANCKTSIMASSNEPSKLRKRKYDEVSMSEDSSDTGMASKKHCNAVMNEVKHEVSDSDSSVHTITENNKISSYLKDDLERNNSGGKLQSGVNSDESHSDNSFAPKQSLVSVKKEDSGKGVVVRDASDEENRRSAINSEHLKKKISSFVTKKLHKEEDTMVFSEEVTSDDETWIVQAPKSMNITAFFEQNFSLNDNFLLRGNNGKVYEGFVSRTSNKRNASVVIPSRNRKSLQLRALAVAGSIIIEEKVNVPCATTLTLRKKKKTPLPQGLRQRHPLLGTAFEEQAEPAEVGYSSLHKKEKKGGKRNSLEESFFKDLNKSVNNIASSTLVGHVADKIVHSLSEESDIHSRVEKKKKKKKKRKHEDSHTSGTDEIESLSALNEQRKPNDINDMETDVVDNSITELKKKKKKHHDISDTRVEMVDVTTELESDGFVKKKKKKKKKDSFISDSGAELVDNVTTELVLDSFVKEKKQKKKKKYSDLDDGEEELSNMPDREIDARIEGKGKKKKKHKESSL